MTKIKELYNKYKEIILYIFYGGLTTLVNLIAYAVFEWILGERLYLVTNLIAWILAAAFAYIVNKLFVFELKSWAPKQLAKEIPEFFLARVFSFVVEELGMLMFVDGFNFSEINLDIFGLFNLSGPMIAKIILAVIVVIMNYFFSKFIIFKKKPSEDSKEANKNSEGTSTVEVSKEENTSNKENNQ